MTREEARRRQKGEVPGPDDDGPDPAEDPALYLEDGKEEGEKKKWTSGS